LLVVDALKGKTWQALRGLGNPWHRNAASGIGAGISYGIKVIAPTTLNQRWDLC